MSKQLIETGKIVGTHGVHGCLKVQPWADSPSVLTGIKRIFVDETPFGVTSAQVHKNCVLMQLEGVGSIDEAIRFKNKVIFVKREDIGLGEGEYFIADLVGLTAIDAETGAMLGKVAEVLTLPASNVYVVKGEREILIPAVPEFIAETNLEKGYIRFSLIEGL